MAKIRKKIILAIKNNRTTILSVVIFGFFSHGFALFNKFSVFDDVYCMYSLGATINSGRWFLYIIGKFENYFYGSSSFSMPLFNGMLSILLIACSVCAIVNLFEIKNRWFCIGIGGLMVTFPVITSLMGYMFTAPAYSLAIIFSVVAGYIICKYRKWYSLVIGTLLLACSLGIYQAYISVYSSIVFIYLIKQSFVSKKTGKSSWIEYIKSAIFFVVPFVLGLVLYAVVTKLFLIRYNFELNSYAGLNNMGQLSLSEFIHRAFSAYFRFICPGEGESFISKNSANMFPLTIRYLYYLLLVLIGLLSILLVAKALKKSKAKGFQLLILLLALPLVINCEYIMCETKVIYSLLLYSQVMLFVFFVILIENIKVNNKLFGALIHNSGVVILLLFSVMYIRYDNSAYLKIDLYQHRMISYFTTLTTQIKSTSGYSDELPVTFVNERKIHDKSFSEDENLECIEIPPYLSMDFLINDYSWKEFLRNWTGYEANYVAPKSFELLSEVKDMPSYPTSGSIKIINDTVVVKF